MKRFIAVCMLIICIALPVICLAATCANCGASGAIHRYDGSRNEISSTHHDLMTFEYTSCAKCHQITILNILSHIQGPHNWKHSKTWVTPTLTYEYDYCTTCGYQTMGTTIYH